MNSKRFDVSSLLAEARTRDTYWEERAILEFTQEFLAKMKTEGISRAELARRLGTTPPYVTKILRGRTNFTLETMVRIARRLGCELRTRLQPEGARSVWFDVLTAEVEPRAALESCRDIQRELDQYTVSPPPVQSKEGQDDTVTSAA